jgi:SEC-C motif domain protein
VAVTVVAARWTSSAPSASNLLPTAGPADPPDHAVVPACEADPVAPRRCPCGTGLTYADCCGRLHDGTATAATAEQLMRSRYSAFAVGDPTYLLASWHPTTRPRTLHLDPAVRWTGLDVLATTGGGLLMAEGTVEFRAHWVAGGERGAQHEDSRFTRADGAWRYVDGVALP